MTTKAVLPYNNRIHPYFGTATCLLLSITMIVFGKEVKDGIYSGLGFCFTTILPTLFPFFILSDLWASCYYINTNGHIARCFERLFKINGCAISSVVCGLICGFPMGVKLSSKLYENGRITKGELEGLCGFVNNPSLAFVVSGVGLGMLGSIKHGITLYIAVIISALLVGMFFSKKREFISKSDENSRQSFNLTKSIGSAGISSVSICSFIIFFSGLIGLISSVIKSHSATAVISGFLEISNAVKMIAACDEFPLQIRLILIAFALGFSGLSVHLQAFSFLPAEISRSKYLLMKLLQGVICSVIMMFFLLIK
ncbi:MAG: hypothetical protein J6V80_03120 [Clostridia bacterium]|nr:hypothetical protein [Clostridia bacterium]